MLIDLSTLKATIILLILKDQYGDFYFAAQTYVNGREVGYKLQSRANYPDDKNTFVAITEDRNSDSIRLVSGGWKDFSTHNGGGGQGWGEGQVFWSRSVHGGRQIHLRPAN